MPKVILKGFIQVPDDDLGIVINALGLHRKLTHEEPGCLEFRVDQDEEQSNRFIVYEEFESEEAFDFHQRRVKSSKWGEVTRNVERHYTICREP